MIVKICANFVEENKDFCAGLYCTKLKISQNNKS